MSSPGIIVTVAAPSLSNVWCTLLARHAQSMEQQQSREQRPEQHVPISPPDRGIMWPRQPEACHMRRSVESTPSHYRQLMPKSRPKPQKPPDVALDWAASVTDPIPTSASASARVAFSISVHIVSLRFDPHAPDPQLAMTNDFSDAPPLAALPAPAVRADSQRQMLIKWLISTLQSNCNGNSGQDSVNAMALQFCNNLKYVGVLKQISNEQQETMSGFSVSSMNSPFAEIGHRAEVVTALAEIDPSARNLV
ncbi:hypothetical protein ACLKA7_003827 [Drosophila subpalustris]